MVGLMHIGLKLYKIDVWRNLCEYGIWCVTGGLKSIIFYIKLNIVVMFVGIFYTISENLNAKFSFG